MVLEEKTNCCINTRRRIVAKTHGAHAYLIWVLEMDEECWWDSGERWWLEYLFPSQNVVAIDREGSHPTRELLLQSGKSTPLGRPVFHQLCYTSKEGPRPS